MHCVDLMFPLEGQNIKTDDTNILIRSLTKKKKIQHSHIPEKVETKGVVVKDTKGKRFVLYKVYFAVVTVINRPAEEPIRASLLPGLKKHKSQGTCCIDRPSKLNM